MHIEPPSAILSSMTERGFLKIAVCVIAVLWVASLIYFFATEPGAGGKDVVVASGRPIDEPVRAPAESGTRPAPRGGSPERPPSGEKVYRLLGFNVLAGFDFDVYGLGQGVNMQGRPEVAIPAEVMALSGLDVAIQGFMIPLDAEDEGTRTFIVMKNQAGCCFGAVPRMHEWVYATMRGGKFAEYFPYMPVVARGTIQVGPEFDEKGNLVSVYRLACDEVSLDMK